jgi:GPI mannosyltransferase 1 subunit X
MLDLDFHTVGCVLLIIMWPGFDSSYAQAGISQKSIGCMPCSRTYVADAHLDIFSGQLDLHHHQAEMSYSGDMCNGFAGDVDVPTLSELDRELVGEGSHRSLVYSMKFGACQDAMVSFLDSYDTHLVMIEKLPNGVFADPFELRHFVEKKGENQTPRLTV